MKDKKKFRKVAIILTIIMILVDVILYKMLEVSALVEMSETSLVTDLAIMAFVQFSRGHDIANKGLTSSEFIAMVGTKLNLSLKV